MFDTQLSLKFFCYCIGQKLSIIKQVVYYVYQLPVHACILEYIVQQKISQNVFMPYGQVWFSLKNLIHDQLFSNKVAPRFQTDFPDQVLLENHQSEILDIVDFGAWHPLAIQWLPPKNK